LQRAASSGADNGRAVAADIVASSPGVELWSATDMSLRSSATGQPLGAKPGSVNFLLWWDGDLLRELADGVSITKGSGELLFRCTACMSNNHSKATPVLVADLLGDFREEIVWRTPDSSALRIYLSTERTTQRLYTLMHDPQYRMQISAQQTGYNQPPHPGFFLGIGMAAPPEPNIQLR
jgi:rhamnogalacturonan endolyase